MNGKIEVFSAGCPLCKDTLSAVKEAVAKKGCGCQIIERTCKGDSCCEHAKKYKISSVPTIVKDEEILHVGKASVEEIQAKL
jgi:alkyl hydroperoxide reductase subunit AhpF